MKLTESDWQKIEGLYLPKWLEWIAYRREMKFKPYKSTRMAKKLSRYPKNVQEKAIDHSMTLEYQGIFPDNFAKEHEKPLNKAMHPSHMETPDIDIDVNNRDEETANKYFDQMKKMRKFR